MPLAELDGLTLYYERAGTGPPLLFISGTGGDLRSRPNVFDGPLAKSFDILAFDQRGLGRSGKPEQAYAMSDYAEDAAKLLGFMGWEKSHVMGLSFGGMVAMEFAIRHPELIDRLVLGCTSPGGEGGSSFPFHELTHLSPEERARNLIGVSDTRRNDAWREAHPEVVEDLVRLAHDPYAEEPGRRQGALRQLSARANHDAFSRLQQIKCPTLIAAGRYDGIAKPSAQRAMASEIKGAELRFFEGGHLFMIQDRSAFPAMTEFLQGTGVPAAEPGL